MGAVTLAAPRWVAATDTLQARCEVDGSIEPVDRSATARPIRFRVWLPADWNGRAVQQGGGGMNGSIPDLSGGRYPIGGRSPAQLGFATFGSDSGHQMTPGPQEWALNDEAMKNLGYAQLKKTRDAAMVLMERVYGARPRYTYFTGTSQGGREALTVAQRYPADYDGVIANVPIVSFSSLMLAPELIRIQEKPLGQLGHAGEGERDSRRVHAPMRRARRCRRRRDQQLHGVPCDLRRQPGPGRPPAVAGEAVPRQRRSKPR